MDRQRKRRFLFVLGMCAAFVFYFLYGYLADDKNKEKLTNQKYQTSKKPKPYEVTVVTLYVPIGKFQKGGSGNIYTNERYRGWMQTFGWLENKLVAFLSDDDTYQYFKNIRSHLPPERTVLIKISRSDLNSFKDYDKVNQIYSAASYPKHHPNTVNANYSVVMNAKYEVLQKAMDMGHVDTDYIAWLDIGCFRNLPQKEIRPNNDSFTLEAPLDMDPTKVAFTEVGGRDFHKNVSPWEYIKNNYVWVAGSFFIGQKEVVKKFICGYQKTLQSLLNENMASTDQQVIGAMYSPQYVEDQEVEIKTYRCRNGQYGLYSSDIQYFCLAYICKEAAELRKAKLT